MTDPDHIQAQLADLKRRADHNAHKRAEIIANLNADYPHLCDQCGGTGGEISYDWGSFTEPPCHDFEACSVCLGEGLNPLDITSTLSEDEVEAWIDKVLDDMKYPLPPHADLEALMQEAEALGEEHADLLDDDPHTLHQR